VGEVRRRYGEIVDSKRTGRGRFTAALAASVLVGAATAGVVSAFAGHDADDPGSYSVYTRGQLSELIKSGSRNPVLFPRDLPPGAGSQDDPGFLFYSNPVTSDTPRRAGQVWLTSYDIGALPPAVGNVSGYFVYQEWQRAPKAHQPRCTGGGNAPNQKLVRHIGDDDVTICLGPHPTSEARHYWATVEFTSDLNQVAWLRG